MAEAEQAQTEASPSADSLSSTDTSLFQKLESYPWSTDEEFQSGLTAILGSSTDPTQVRDLTLRARCFYYERRFNQPIDFSAYKTWHERHSRLPGSDLQPNDALPTAKQLDPESNSATAGQLSADSALTSEPPPEEAMPHPHGFAEIMRMIQSGEPIPGIKEIAPTVLEGQGSQSSQTRRPKPWEGEGKTGERQQGQLFGS